MYLPRPLLRRGFSRKGVWQKSPGVTEARIKEARTQVPDNIHQRVPGSLVGPGTSRFTVWAWGTHPSASGGSVNTAASARRPIHYNVSDEGRGYTAEVQFRSRPGKAKWLARHDLSDRHGLPGCPAAMRASMRARSQVQGKDEGATADFAPLFSPRSAPASAPQFNTSNATAQTTCSAN